MLSAILAAWPTALRIAVRRLNGNRRLMAAVAVGVILAVALMASTVIYRGALRQLGLQTDLNRVPDAEIDVRVLNSAHGLARGLSDESFDTIDRRLRIARDYISGTVESLTSATFFMTELGEAPPEQDPRDRSRILYFEGIQDKIELLEGRWPDAGGPAAPDAPPTIEVAIGQRAAEAGGFQLGTRRAIHPSWQDDTAPITIEVVGIVTPIDYTERYWGVRRDHFQVPTETTDAFAFFAPRETLVDTMAGYLPTLRARLEVLALVDRPAFTSDLAAEAALRFRGAFEAIAKEIERTRVETEIVKTLDAYETKEFFSSIPLLVLTLQIVGIVLFYLVLVSTMVVERQQSEVALLKSRGAGLWHIMAISAIEGVLLVALGLGLGPLVAQEAIALLGFAPAFDGLTGGARLTVELTGETYIWAAIGAALSFIALLWPAWRSNRATVVHYVRATSRPQDKPAFQRYYLDLVVVGIGALLFFQLQDSGSLVTEDLFGGLDQDPLLLIAPAVFVVTVAVLFLRLFPVLLSGFAWIARQIGGASMQMVLWHLTPRPRPTRTPRAASDHGHQPRHVRRHLRRNPRSLLRRPRRLRIRCRPPPRRHPLRRRIGPDARSRPCRRPRRRRPVSRRPRQRQLHPRRARRHRRHRARRRPRILRRCALVPRRLRRRRHRQPARPDRRTRSRHSRHHHPRPRRALHRPLALAAGGRAARSRPASASKTPRGAIATYGSMASRAGAVSAAARSRKAGASSSATCAKAQSVRTGPEIGPWQVLAVGIRASGFSSFSGRVIYDDLQYSASADLPEDWNENGFRDGVVIEGFETQGRWTVFSDILRGEALPDDARLSSDTVYGGQTAMRYSWAQQIQGRSGIPARHPPRRPRRTRSPSSSATPFLEEAALEVGSRVTIGVANIFVPVIIRGSFDLFPTWDPQGGRSLILADRTYLDYRVNRNPTSGRLPRAQRGLGSAPPTTTASSNCAATSNSPRPGSTPPGTSRPSATCRDEDPLIAAGWEGLLFITFIAIVLLSALGFLVASVLVAQQQQGEFAVLRTMGFSTRQVLIVVGLEKLLIIFVSMAIGTLLGLQLGVMMHRIRRLRRNRRSAAPALRHRHRLGHHRRRLRRPRPRLPRRNRRDRSPSTCEWRSAKSSASAPSSRPQSPPAARCSAACATIRHNLRDLPVPDDRANPRQTDQEHHHHDHKYDPPAPPRTAADPRSPLPDC